MSIKSRLEKLKDAWGADGPAITAAVVEDDGRVSKLLTTDGGVKPAPFGMTVNDVRGPVKVYGFDPTDCSPENGG